MNKQNLHKLDEAVEKEYEKRDKKKKQKMKVSGTGVKELQRIITRNTEHET